MVTRSKLGSGSAKFEYEGNAECCYASGGGGGGNKRNISGRECSKFATANFKPDKTSQIRTPGGLSHEETTRQQQPLSYCYFSFL
jgi:hypothetical protein